MAEAYTHACRAASLDPLPPVLHCLQGQERVVALAGNSVTIAQLKRRLGDADVTLACAALAAHANALRRLDFSFNTLTDAGAAQIVAALGALIVVAEIDFSESGLGPAGAQSVLGAPVARTARALRGDGNNIGDAGARSAAALVSSSTSLHVLSLAHCGVGIDGLISLASAVPLSASLTDLDVSQLALTSRNEEVAGHVADMLKASRTLTRLALRKTPHLTYTGLAPILEAVLANPVLTSLDLSGCALGPPAGLALATAMARGLGLRELHLAQCALGDEGAVALARVIACGQSSLVELDLRGNGIGDEGVVALADALTSEQCTLVRLSVWANPGLKLIPGGRPGMEALAAAQPHALSRGMSLDVQTYDVDGVAHVARV